MDDGALHPRLRDPDVLRALAREYAAAGGTIRVPQVLAPGLADALPEALREAYGGNTWMADFVNYAGLAGLV
ncbi:MAG: hypothetical protein ACLGHP_11450, partial [Vicinamibacteria bacterium]